MRFPKTAALTTIAVLFCLPHGTLAEGNEHTATHATEGVHLSPGLTDLLHQEMTAIEKGMMDLIPAIPAGNWDAAAEWRVEKNGFVSPREARQAWLAALTKEAA